MSGRLVHIYKEISAGAQESLFTLNWRSTSGNDEALAQEIARLYLALYNTGNLAVREVENPEALFVETLARREGVFFGTYFPQAIDSLFCDLNTAICSRPMIPALAADLEDVTAHLAGTAPSTAQWAVNPKAPVRLPDYSFTRFTTLGKVPVPEGWTPNDYFASEDLDCSIWNMGCREVVEQLNKAQIAPSDGPPTAAVPVTGLSTQLPLKLDFTSIYREVFEELTQKQPATGVEFALPDTPFFLRSPPRIDQTLEAIEGNIDAVGRASAFGAKAEPLYDEQVDLLRLIHHPFVELDELPEIYREPVDVLVLDSAFDTEHCDLVIADTPAPPEVADPCTEVNATPHALNDHAAHVIGLIGAPMNGKGMVGLNPAARVHFAPINREFSSPADIDDAKNKLIFGAVSARVANLSWGFNRDFGSDAFRNEIKDLDESLLVVAAAGNEKKDVPANDCRIFPACLYDLENVITVVGLDTSLDDPKLWSGATAGSNSSPNFHIAAIAENVLSTVPHNKVGRMSGTSQAAPQVTAAASLIFAAAEKVYSGDLGEDKRLHPKYVKDRLIYTADFFPDLQSQVASGRLNVSRAINIVDTQIELRRDGNKLPVNGRLSELGTDIIVCDNPNGPGNLEFTWDSIRRLHFVEDRQRYVIYYHEKTGDRLSELIRFDGCNMKTRNNEGLIVDHNNQDVPFVLKEVMDYTSPLLE